MIETIRRVGVNYEAPGGGNAASWQSGVEGLAPDADGPPARLWAGVRENEVGSQLASID